MGLSEIRDYYYSKMTQIYLYQSAMKELTSNEFNNLNKYNDSISLKPEMEEHSHSFHNMAFKSAQGKRIFFGSKQLSIKDRQLAVILHKNKQYQWLLSEAYEEFEDCIERFYAYLGHADNNFWPLKDFGNISLNELQQKPFEWFLVQASKKKDAPSSIISKFRDTYKNIEKQEKNNALEINLYLAITLIEMLRHVIVHKGGDVDNKSKFNESVLSKCGLYNQGSPVQEHVDFINQFFSSGDFKNTILLLEFPIDPYGLKEFGLQTYIDVFEVFSGYLMAYIDILFETISDSQNKTIQLS
jgi:hypothetical protein